jgi:hypothetical protein
MKYIFILTAVILVGCNSEQEELATQEFIDSVFLLEQTGGHSWQPGLNRGLSEDNPYFYFMHENELALGYLQWNLIDGKLPDSIKYSTKSQDEVQRDFQSFANQDEDIKKAVQLLIYPNIFKEDFQIDVDSLVNLSAKLFFASDAGEGRIGWSLCAGKSKFSEFYGESDNYKSIALQALCFQAVFLDQYSSQERTLWNTFDDNIAEVSAEMNDLEYDDYIETANQLMWQKMSESRELKNLMNEFVTHEMSKLYFEISGS